MAKKNKKKNGHKKVISLASTGAGKLQALRKIADDCNKALGVSGKVYLGSEAAPFKRRSTGIVALDYVLGGGLVEGQMVQFEGAESSFKTTALLVSIATILRDDPDATAVILAGEGWDSAWAKKWNVDTSRVFVIAVTAGDEALETALTMIESGNVTLLGIDSVQSLAPSRELEGGVDSESYAGAGAPQMWGRVMRRVYAAMNSGITTCTVVISQVRAKIGGYSPRGVPDPEGTSIWALKHWRAALITFKKGEIILDGDGEKRQVMSWDYNLRCKKNKTATPERTASFTVRRSRTSCSVVRSRKSFTIKKSNSGPWIDNAGALVRLGVAYGLIEQSGGWFRAYGHKIQGLDQLSEKLKESPSLMRQLHEQVYDEVIRSA